MGPLVASHFGARFALLAWTGAGILKTGEPCILLLSMPVPALVALCRMPWIRSTSTPCSGLKAGAYVLTSDTWTVLLPLSLFHTLMVCFLGT